MTSLRMHVLVGGAMLLTAGALAAQERPAVASGEQKTNQKQADAGVRPAFGEGGAHAGDYVAVTRKDGQKMTGTLVWIDEKNNRAWLPRIVAVLVRSANRCSCCSLVRFSISPRPQ